MAYFSNLVAPSAPANNALSNKVDPLSSLMAPFQQGSWYKGLPSYNTGNTSTFGAGSTVPKTTTATPSGSAPLLPVKPKVTTAGVQPLVPISTPSADPFKATPDQLANAKTPDQLRAAGAPVDPNSGGTTPPAPQTYDSLYQGAATAAQGAIPIGKSAADIAADYGARIADVGQKGATARGGYLTTGTSPVAEGNAAVLAQTTAAEQNALAAGESAALQGTGQQLTAQSQATSGLLGAAGLTPEALRYGSNAGSLNPLNNVDSLAQQVLSHQLSPSQAYAMGGSIPGFQGVLNQKILALNPSANVAQLQGEYDARQANTTTAGTAPTNAYASAYQQNYPIQLAVQGQLQNVQNLGGLLIGTGGTQVNPFDLKYANQTLGNFKGQLSSTQQAQFNQSLATYAGALSQLLAGSTTVTPTQTSAWVNGILDGSLSMSALKASYDQALREGNIKLQTAQSQTNIPGAQIGAPTVGGNTNPLGI